MSQKTNNLGVLRLMLASFVIVGHAPEMTDGSRQREPLTMLFHTLSLGDVSVDAFFLLSGFLITMSWQRSESLSDYLRKRVRRILPGYVCAFLLSCVFVMVWGGRAFDWPSETVQRLLTLQPPPSDPSLLKVLHYDLVNGSLWTISYEFRAYIFMAIVGLLGFLSARRMLLLAVLLNAAAVAITFPEVKAAVVHGSTFAADRRGLIHCLVGEVPASARLMACFSVGSCVYLHRHRLLAKLNGRHAAACAALACVLMAASSHFAELGFTVFGGVALLWFALKARIGRLQAINDRWDISYGVYLYGWPIATSILCFTGMKSPVLLAVSTLPLAFAAGTISWFALERPARHWVAAWSRGRTRQGAPAELAVATT